MLTQTWGRILAWAAAASGLMGCAGTVAGQQPPQAVRSTQDTRPRLIDEHDRPYARETQSHRGFEIREPQFTVVATTSREDARWAAGHVTAALGNAAQLAGRWTAAAENPDFGLSSLQVVIDGEPVRERDAPAPSVNVVGIQTQVVLHVGKGQPPLERQVVRLREAVALASLHTAGVDSAAPPWVVAGLAAHAGRQGLSDAELKAAATLPAEALGGQQWRFARASQDLLAYQHVDQAAAASQVAFLLTGSDAQHAPALLAALRAATDRAAVSAADGGGFRKLPGDLQLAERVTDFDRLIADRSSEFKSWQEDPLAGQPVVEAAEGALAELAEAQAEMLVLLKLHRRLSSAAAGKSPGGSRVKIVSLNKTTNDAAPSAPPPQAVHSFGELAARLSDPSQPAWATIDANGRLLLSSDTLRVAQLLANDPPRYTLQSTDRGVELVRKLDGGRELRGWLAKNDKQASRPLAKFELVRGGFRPVRQAESEPARAATPSGR